MLDVMAEKKAYPRGADAYELMEVVGKGVSATVGKRVVRDCDRALLRNALTLVKLS